MEKERVLGPIFGSLKINLNAKETKRIDNRTDYLCAERKLIWEKRYPFGTFCFIVMDDDAKPGEKVNANISIFKLEDGTHEVQAEVVPDAKADFELYVGFPTLYKKLSGKCPALRFGRPGTIVVAGFIEQ